MATNLGCYGQNMLKVSRAVFCRGRAHSDEQDITLFEKLVFMQRHNR